MIKNILMIVYFFDQKDGVGSLRSITLNKFLNENDFLTEVIDKKYFGGIFNRSFTLWSFAVFLKILISKEKKVYVSCGPFQHLLFVSLASYLSGKELIIDFRDPWSLNIKRGYNNSVKVNKAKLIISSKIEKMSYKICNSFIVCTRGMYEEYNRLFANNDKLVLMTNGYDFEPKQGRKVIDLSNLNVICLGKFAEYDKEKAALALIKARVVVKNKKGLTLHFVGSDKDINMKLLGSLNLSENAVFYPHMDYNKALEIASYCDLALLVIRDEDIEYGTKIFDYIGLGIPIIDIFNEKQTFKKEFNQHLFPITESRHEDKKIYNRQQIYKTIFLKLI